MCRFVIVLHSLLSAALMTFPASLPAVQPQPALNAEDTRLANLLQSYLDQEFQRHPLYATQQGNHDFDDQLDDLSPAARKKDAEATRAMLATLEKEIDFRKLSRNGQIDRDIWSHAMKY